MANITLTQLTEDDREQFILDNQYAFKYGAMEEFGERDIHFYVNKCGFHIVEFFNSHHPDPHDPETGEENNYEGEDFDGMFRFEKQMNGSVGRS